MSTGIIVNDDLDYRILKLKKGDYYFNKNTKEISLLAEDSSTNITYRLILSAIDPFYDLYLNDVKKILRKEIINELL